MRLIGSSDVAIELIRDIPSILWFMLAAVVLLVFRQQLGALLPSLQALKLPGGVEAKFHTALTTAVETRGLALAPQRRTRLERRAARDADVLEDARVLWVDDDHRRTAPERQALSALGVEVVLATTTDEGLEKLAIESFDLVLSDMKRGDDAQAGLDLLRRFRAHASPPIIFYVGRVDPARPAPVGAFGITNHPDELLHLVMDALCRRRG
jgi:CheY-like chemotaxis protein